MFQTIKKNIDREFINAIAAAGITPPKSVFPDGEIHRFSTNGDRNGEVAGWYILFPEDPPAGAFGDWRQDISQKWCSIDIKKLPTGQRKNFEKRISRLKNEQEKKQRQMHAKAAEKAKRIWQQAKPVKSHPYLKKKQVGAYGIKIWNGKLVVPVYINSKISTLQFISKNKKRFLSDGKISGGYFKIGKPEDVIYISEGYATGATIHALTGCCTYVAFNAGNLLKVARYVQKNYPNSTIIIAGDNDRSTSGNPGKTKAQEAAGMIGGEWVVPNFTNGIDGSDFNDLYKSVGPETVKKELKISKKERRLYLLTDGGNAERFADQYQSELIFCSDTGRWREYQDGCFNKISEGFLRRKAIATVRKINSDIDANHSRDDVKKIQKWARQSEYLSRINAMLTIAEGFCEVGFDQFDADPMLLNVKNGVVDLKNGRLLPHDKNYMMTKLCNVAYDESAKAPRWEEHLRSIFDNDGKLIQFSQRAIGYSLTAMTTEDVLFFAYGTGRNGKTTTLETIMHILDNYSIKTRQDLLVAQRYGGGDKELLAHFPNKRMAVASETDNRWLAESVVKDLTGGDTISARHLYRPSFQFRPTHKLWIYGNHKPTIRGTDDGIWRRINLIPFTVKIPKSDIDTNLQEKLLAEAAGILNWAIEGCLDWQKQGLNPPDSVRNATEEYRDEMDILGQFLDEMTVQQPGARVYSQELYAEYKNWCQNSGFHALSHTKFGIELKERGLKKARDSQGKFYQNIGLKSDRSSDNVPF